VVRGLLGLHGMPSEEVVALLDAAEGFADLLRSGGRPEAVLSDRTVTTVFFEPSTRTRLSFEKAASMLGAHVMSFIPEVSSTSKGEAFRDTILTLAAMGTDLFVVRHGLVDAPELAGRWSGVPVINAGSGRREHPTQTLIDLLTLRQRFGELGGLRMAIVGDVRNSRVARSHLAALPGLGVEVTLVGPPGLLPEANPWGVELSSELDDELGGLDVVYLLRIQRERGADSGFPSDAAYARRYGMNEERLSMLKPGTVIMHPGPINRGVEIDDAAADGERSLILEQVANGIPIRMAVLAAAIEDRS
jgi:aspartate carbamoyltransferase catalytic subunit